MFHTTPASSTSCAPQRLAIVDYDRDVKGFGGGRWKVPVGALVAFTLCRSTAVADVTSYPPTLTANPGSPTSGPSGQKVSYHYDWAECCLPLKGLSSIVLTLRGGFLIGAATAAVTEQPLGPPFPSPSVEEHFFGDVSGTLPIKLASGPQQLDVGLAMPVDMPVTYFPSSVASATYVVTTPAAGPPRVTPTPLVSQAGSARPAASHTASLSTAPPSPQPPPRGAFAGELPSPAGTHCQSCGLSSHTAGRSEAAVRPVTAATWTATLLIALGLGVVGALRIRRSSRFRRRRPSGDHTASPIPPEADF